METVKPLSVFIIIGLVILCWGYAADLLPIERAGFYAIGCVLVAFPLLCFACAVLIWLILEHPIKLILGIGALFFISCKPCERFARKHPECFTTDTIRIPSAKADTVFKQSEARDTVILQKERLTVKYYHSNDTVFLSGECRDSVIVREVKASPTEKEKWWEKWYIWIGIAGALLALALLFKR